MSSEPDFDVKHMRMELGLSQTELASLVGVSTRAIQSYEQGWRRPSENVQRHLLLLLIALRRGSHLQDHQCWKSTRCPPEIRDRCIAYVTRQGHICWFLTGTICKGKRAARWAEKLRECLQCDFMQELLPAPGRPDGDDESGQPAGRRR